MHKITDQFHIKEIQRYYHYLHNCQYVFPGHRHHDTELNIILAGEMEIACETGIYKVKKGEMLLIPSYTFHQNRVTGNQSAAMIVVQFDVATGVLRDDVCICQMDDKMECLVDLFCNEMEQHAEIKDGACFSVSENAIKLFEIFLQSAFKGEQAPFIRENEISMTYNKAVSYMRENLSCMLSTADIARECGVCSTTLKKIFSYYTGRGCISFFNELKLECAKEMLAEGKSCLEVSDYLGFSSQGYFSRWFKKMHGISPVQYKTN